MTNEIKEIINNLIEYRNSDYKCKQPEDCLTIEDVWLLLDYITNLQEKYKETDKSYTKMIYKYNKVLSRNEKAIQYINKYEYQRYCPSPYEKEKYIMREEEEGQDLLNILRGEE